MAKAPSLPTFTSAQSLTAESERLRKEILQKIVFHGWPPEWINAATRFEQVSEPIPGKGYRIRKLRYQIVPGLYGSAILYEPLNLSGKVPAILNVNGHVGPPGKAIEYKQKRCINQALQGMLSLNLEWFAYGDLENKENQHWFGAHLDLAGANGVGLFYLAMRRGLDYLASHANADPARLGVTGLSGGGWQTIFLSALDDRVAVSAPVAGYSSVVSRIERGEDTGDLEQNPTDLLTIADYPLLTAMRAPKPTLLAYNAEDDCCFRASLVKPYIFDQVLPAFQLFQKKDQFAWHTNTDPGNHNYQLDNREASYRFFAKHFNLTAPTQEADVASEVRTREQLSVPLPADNLTILGLAKKLADRRTATAKPEAARLTEIVRYRPVDIKHAWAVRNSQAQGIESRSLRLDFANGLSASAVWLRPLNSSGPVTIVLNDRGKVEARAEVSGRLNRGEQVLALDLLFIGDAAPRPAAGGYSQLIATLGERPLGLIAAQLNGAARWILRETGATSVHLSTTGIRSQVASLVAAALEPALFGSLDHSEGAESLRLLFDRPTEYLSAPELFCFGLYREFDIRNLKQLSNARRN